MAAPSGTVWGSICSNNYGRIGIYVKLTTTAKTVTREVQVWFWSKYSVQDETTTLYYDCGKNVTSATTSKGTYGVYTYNDTGSGWDTANQQLLQTYTAEYDRGTSASTYKIYVKLTNAYNCGTMLANTSYTIPALASYTVTYNANGGSGAPSSQTKWYGKDLTISSTKPTRTGYSFQGWATSASGSVAYAAGAKYTANAAVTLYAIWKANTYTVKYDANGGSGAPSSQTKTYGTALKLSSTKPTRTGYSFQGWATSASGSVAYAAGASYTSNSAVTLYAVWKINTYAVTYNANGGSGVPSSQTKTYGKTLTLSSTKPTRTGYAFVSWNTKSDGSGTSYASGASYTANAAITLYAIWKINTYTITYNANGGTLGSVKTQTKTYGTALKLTGTATRSGYTFKGWATSSSGSVTYTSGASYTANATATLYAVWEISYVKPRITGLTVARCDASNQPTDEGTYALVKFSWKTDNAVPSVVIDWKPASSTSYSSSDKQSVNASGTGSSVTQRIGGKLNTDTVYTIRVTVTDSGGSTSTTFNLPASIYHIDFKPPTKANEVGGVAVGKPAEIDNLFDIGYSTRFYGGIKPIVLASGTDFNTLLTPNLYIGATFLGDGTNLNYVNSPSAISCSFLLEVLPMRENDRFMQRLTLCYKGNSRKWERHYYSSSWGDWYCTYADANTLLLDCASYMHDGQIYSLAEPISKQPNGIVLVFCRYQDKEAQNDNYNSFFISKHEVKLHPGAGHTFVMFRGADNPFKEACVKYLYITDTTIKGHAQNSVTTDSNNNVVTGRGTGACGIAYNNNAFVLRHVIGV